MHASVQRILSLLEALHFHGLTHHGSEQSPHQAHDSVLQLMTSTIIGCMAPIRDSESPHRVDAVNVVSHPGIGIIPMHSFGGTGGEEPSYGVLSSQDHRINGLKIAIELTQTLVASR